MATIKSYTDLEQSKKLAEILPPESADGFWGFHTEWGLDGDNWEGYDDYPSAVPYLEYTRKENEWKEETTFGGFVYHCCYDGKRFIMDSLYSLAEQDKIDIHPATTEQRNILFQKMKEAGYEWDTDKKKLKNLIKYL